MNPKLVKVPPLMKVKAEQKGGLAAQYHVGLDGLLSDVLVGPTQRLRNLQQIAGVPDNTLEGKTLVDTGAVFTCIDQEAVIDLGLQKVDHVDVNTSLQSSVLAPVYTAEVAFAGYVFELFAVAVNLKKNDLLSLIGRDILQLGTLCYSGVEGDWNFEIPGLSPA